MNRLIDHQTLHHLQFYIGSEMLPMIAQLFIRQGQESLAQIEAASSKDELQSLCHTLKRSAHTVGAIRLAKEAESLYLELKQGASELMPDTQNLCLLLKGTLAAMHIHLIPGSA